MTCRTSALLSLLIRLHANHLLDAAGQLTLVALAFDFVSSLVSLLNQR